MPQKKLLLTQTVTYKNSKKVIENYFFLKLETFSRRKTQAKTEWSPKLGEGLVCRKDERKEAKEHDEYVVATFIQECSKPVGHVPIELSFLLFTFLRAHKSLEAGNSVENSIVISGTLKAVTRSR